MDEKTEANARNEETVLFIDAVTGEEYGDDDSKCVNGCKQIRGDENIKAARKEAAKTREAYAAKQKKSGGETKAATKSENK